MKIKKQAYLILFCLQIFITHKAIGQALLPKSNFKNLVFEGAGMKGIAYSGCLKALEELEVLKQIENVGGTSSGSIIATLFAVGYTPKEIKSLVENTPYQNFNDGKYFFIGGFYRMKKQFGWYNGDEFIHWLEKQILLKTGNADITFKQLDSLKKVKLHITGTNLTKQESAIFNVKNFPNMRVADAVRISISIPFYFKPVLMDSNGKVYNKFDSNANLSIMVDGGMTANFPIQIFDHIDSNGLRIANLATLAIRIDRPEQKAYNEQGKGIAPQNIQSLNDFVYAFYTYTIESINTKPLNALDWQRTININSANISSKVRKLSDNDLNILYQNGYEATLAYFKN